MTARLPLIYQSPSYEAMRQPDYWLRGKTWGECYAYVTDWERLIAGTNTRYHWLSSRGRLPIMQVVH